MLLLSVWRISFPQSNFADPFFAATNASPPFSGREHSDGATNGRVDRLRKIAWKHRMAIITSTLVLLLGLGLIERSQAVASRQLAESRLEQIEKEESRGSRIGITSAISSV